MGKNGSQAIARRTSRRWLVPEIKHVSWQPSLIAGFRPGSARPRRPAFRCREIVEARVQGVPPCMPDDDTMGETRSERTFQKGHTSYLSALVCARTSAGLAAPLVVCAQQRIDTASRACDPGFSQPEGIAAKRAPSASLAAAAERQRV